MLKRELYLEKIRPFYNSNLIKVISGVRRSGKSTLMSQIVEELNNSAKVLVINLEDYNYVQYLDDPLKFHKLILKESKDKNISYIFIDEIQRLKDFQRVLASLKATLDCSLFVTISLQHLSVL
jgi:predicted AAA+ superfamily ATPase